MTIKLGHCIFLITTSLGVITAVCFSDTNGECGGNFNSDSGIVASPNFPDPYGNNMDCIWNITVKKPYTINLVFTHFSLEGPQCGSDDLQVN